MILRYARNRYISPALGESMRPSRLPSSRSNAAPTARLAAKLALVLVVLATTALLDPQSSRAQVPSGFADSLVGNVSSPTDIDFTPDGRMLVTSQTGRIYMRIGTAITEIGNLSGRLCSDFERGLLGITPDPDYASNRTIFVFYTYDGGRSDCLRNSSLSPWNRVSRFTLNGDNTVNLGSEVVLVDKMPSPNGNHNAGTIAFGPDGYLYIAIGDGGCSLTNSTNCAGANTNARLRNVLTGKILRVNRNGVAPSTNPFYASGGTCRETGRTTAANCRETYAWGLRNPFKFAFDPIDGRLNINDVGQGVWEEIDRGAAGRDYGWNNCEGNHNRGTTSAGCSSSQTPPIHEYNHSIGCASITGGAFMPESGWPSAYDGRYFFADYTCGRIWTLDTGGTRRDFATGLGAVTELEFGPYGSKTALYYTNYGAGQIRRIVYTDDSNRAPVADASANPTFGALPLRVQFDAGESRDPDGDALTYRWDFGDGDTSTNDNPVNTFTEEGVYDVRLTVTDGNGGSDTDTVRILAGTARPTVQIVTPSVDTRFTVGQRITLKGRATDANGDPISSRNFTWEVLLHHDSHTHPLIQPTSGNDIVFTAPAPEDLAAARTSYVEIRLTARDSNGLGKRVTQRLDPLKVTTTFATSPGGLDLQIEGENLQAPVSLETWAGDGLTVVAPDQIGNDGTPYVYDGWSDGGRRSHTVTVPTTASTVTASFVELAGVQSAPLGDARVRESNASANDGASTGLTVKGGTTTDYETLMRFRVSGASGTIYKAVIYLYAYEGTSEGPAIYRTSPSWSESRVTWGNRPGPVGGQLDNAGPIYARSWVAYDVTETITGEGTYSFLIRGTSTDSVSWYSREASANRPRLVVYASGTGGGIVDEARPASDESPTETVEPTVEATATATPTATATGEPSVEPTVEPTAIATETPTPEPATPEPLPVGDGFEGDLASWQGEGATLAPGAAADGSTAARLTSSGSTEVAGSPAYLLRRVGPDATELYVSGELALVTQDAQPARLLTAYGPEGVEIASVFTTGDGNVGVTYAATGQTEFVTLISPSTWLAIEMRVAIAGDGSATVEVWVDGVLARSDVVATTAAHVELVQIGHRASDRSFDLLVDDVAIDRTCTRSCPAEAPPDEVPAAEEPVATATRSSDDDIEGAATPTGGEG
jgi:glucose/arabinose dehydrogenase/PKD repeat protein